MTLPMDVAQPAEEPPRDLSALHAGAMLDMLRRHYQPDGRPPAGLFAPEVQSPDGRRRADLMWMPTTIAGGRGELHGHEIKCSRADLLNELADPTKADPWAQYCTRWWLVVSRPDLTTGLTIPDAWGILAPPSGRRTRSMTVLREAPKLTPNDPTAGVYRLASWQVYAAHERIGTLDAEVRRKDVAIEGWRQQVAQLKANGARDDKFDEFSNHVVRIVAALRKRTHEERIFTLGDVDEDAVVDALLDYVATARAAEEMRHELRRLAGAADQFVEPFRRAAKSLRRAEQLSANITDGPAAIAAVLAAFPGTEVA